MDVVGYFNAESVLVAETWGLMHVSVMQYNARDPDFVLPSSPEYSAP